MLADRVKCAVPNPGPVDVGRTITLGAAPNGYRRFLAAFGGAKPAYFVLSDGADRTITGIWTVNASVPETATITAILGNDRAGTLAGETFAGDCVAWCAVPAAASLYAGGSWAGAAGGTANALSCTVPMPLVAHIPGMVLRLLCAAANTGPVTLSVNGLAPLPLRQDNGAEIPAGVLQAGSLIEVVASSSGGFRLATAPASTTGRDVLIAASAAAGRAAIGAEPLATSAGGVGQRVALNSGAGNALYVPAGGSWDMFVLSLNASGQITAHLASVAAGGALYSAAVPGINYIGSAKRIA